MCTVVETMTGFICAKCSPDCECVVCRSLPNQCEGRFEDSHHSDDWVFIYTGSTEPSVYCGFHASKREAGQRIDKKEAVA